MTTVQHHFLLTGRRSEVINWWRFGDPSLQRKERLSPHAWLITSRMTLIIQHLISLIIGQSLEQITILQIKITITFKLICFLIFISHFMICRMIWICRSSPLKKSNQNCMLWCCCFVVLTTGQVTKPSPKQNKKWEIWVINMFRIALLGWFMKWKVYQLHFFIIYSLQGRCHGANNDLWLWFAIGQITGIYERIFLI